MKGDFPFLVAQDILANTGGEVADCNLTSIELIATLFGLACVWLYVRENIWSWPTGLVQVCLYAWIFFEARLYSDFLLQLIYIVLQIYGWMVWLRGGGTGKRMAIKRLSALMFTAWMLVGAAGSLGLGWAMHRFTNASFPFLDAFIAVISLIAQYLLAKKVLENWILWVAVDLLAIGVYLAKGLYLTTGLYAVFLCMAIAGWRAWRHSMDNSSKAISSAPDVDSCLENSSPLIAGISSSSTSPVTTATN